MPLFTPTIVFERITCITPEFLGARGLRALILDVDNTLTAHGSQELPPGRGHVAGYHARRRREAHHRLQQYARPRGSLCKARGAGVSGVLL